MLYQAKGHNVVSDAEARSRINASAIAGTISLDSVDLTNPNAQVRVAQLLENREILALAASGRTFRPEGDTGDAAADTLVRLDPDAAIAIRENRTLVTCSARTEYQPVLQTLTIVNRQPRWLV